FHDREARRAVHARQRDLARVRQRLDVQHTRAHVETLVAESRFGVHRRRDDTGSNRDASNRPDHGRLPREAFDISCSLISPFGTTTLTVPVMPSGALMPIEIGTSA